MSTLLIRAPQGTKTLIEEKCKTEEEFEKIVFETEGFLGDIFLLKRQVRGGNKSGIPDIIGIDADGNICIVEMKNTLVDAYVVPQLLQYAIWAEQNPDSIKALWLEAKDKPDNIEISWDSPSVRIIVVAPEIHRSTLDVIPKIAYSIDLLEVKRWKEDEREFYYINKLKEEIPKSPRQTKGLETYDEGFYLSNYNKNSAKAFMDYVRKLEDIVKEKKWQVELKFNKSYCGFKSGFFNAFGITWRGRKTFAFFAKISQQQAESIKIPMTKYENEWKQAIYNIEPGKTDVRSFLPVFERAYQNISGQ